MPAAYLAQELAVRGQVGRPDRRHDRIYVVLLIIFFSRECGDDVLAELVGDEVHGRPAAVPVVHTVEGLRVTGKKETKVRFCMHL